ncbi:MAG: YdcF family protein [Clostridia bacterium]|nr:YdcF family protein [Clostridia bacterium]
MKHTAGKILLGLIVLGVLVYAGIMVFICIREKDVNADKPAADTYDAIIVLGAQVLPTGEPSVQLQWRLDAAMKAWQEKNVPVVVCGAKGADEPETEASVMKAYLEKNGIPAESILTDDASFSTQQNLRNALALLDGTDAGKVLIVTSDYHLPRSLAIAEDLGLDAVGTGSPCKPEYWLKNHAREVLAWCKYWAVKYLKIPLE